MHEYIALIPAYKPDEKLIELINELIINDFKIVIVDDGSGPEYNHIFSKIHDINQDILQIQFDINQGKGAALKAGLDCIKTNLWHLAPIIVTLDADGQHKVKDAIKICQIAENNKNALVLGSRSLNKSAPLRSRFGNSMTRNVFRLSTGVSVKDTQTGLRAFDYSLIDNMLNIEGNRYEYEMNVLLQFAKNKIKIIEEEIETIYIDGNASSHFSPIKDSFRIYKEILKFSASSFISFLIDYSLFTIISLFLSKYSILIAPTIANIIARIISASVNFTTNKHFVFKSKNNIVIEILKYSTLALGILIGNTIVLNLFINYCNLNPLIAKLITETLFFIISFSVQKLFIFKKNK